jgi:hypothetical protein
MGHQMRFSLQNQVEAGKDIASPPMLTTGKIKVRSQLPQISYRNSGNLGASIEE